MSIMSEAKEARRRKRKERERKKDLKAAANEADVVIDLTDVPDEQTEAVLDALFRGGHDHDDMRIHFNVLKSDGTHGCQDAYMPFPPRFDRELMAGELDSSKSNTVESVFGPMLESIISDRQLRLESEHPGWVLTSGALYALTLDGEIPVLRIVNEEHPFHCGCTGPVDHESYRKLLNIRGCTQHFSTGSNVAA
jgi:hypothetical protein